MAVKFKGTSEYKSKFRGRSARARSESPQLRNRKAGLRSDQLGVCREPQFSSKKRVPFHRPQVYRSFQWEEPEELPQQHEPSRESITPAAAPPVEVSRNEERPVTPLAPRGPPASGTQCAETALDVLAHPPSTQPRPAKAEEAEHVPNNGVHHVLKRKAGLKPAGRSNRLMTSEYQREFQGKTPTASGSPLLAAEKMVYGSSPVIPPFKATPLVQETEYRRSFKGSPPPRGPRLRRDLEQKEGVSPDRTPKGKTKKKKRKKPQQLSRKVGLQDGHPQRGMQSQQQEIRSQSPQEPRPSRGGCRKVNSEYSSRFRSPWQYQLKDGIWVKSSTATQEARELRQKADAYRRRAWGTHFSRDHLIQILSEQNQLWEASTTSGTVDSATIQALDLASIVSTAGSPNDRAPVHLTPPSSRGSSASDGEEEPPRNAPTLPVRRKLAWGEAEQGAGPKQKDREREEPHSRKREDKQEKDDREEECRSDKATIAEDPFLSPTSDSDSSERGGRLPTPKMKASATARRTHHDLTTPANGGAILVSPPKMKESSPGGYFRRSEPPLGKTYSPHKPLSRASPERLNGKAEQGGVLLSSPAAGLITADPIPMREDAWPSLPSPNDSPAPCAGTSLGHGRTSPTVPVPAPTNRIHGMLRDPEFQHNGNLGPVRLGIPASPSNDLSDDDERLSQISARSAISCSVASLVLDRAQRRNKTFWSKR
ncbi:hypothetical protein GJAV_G00269030 [Gymnothorax javanicus]|nr:hypothetical protein GJAV_G00269030 [Gymnothorax javanicus]